MSYSCIYERTIFYNPENRHSIIRVRTTDKSIPPKARAACRGKSDYVCFVAKGYNLPQTNKITMILDGEWENSKYGCQLNVESFEEIIPQTDEGIKGYLSSCLIKGIGEKTADEIVARFGADTLRVIENEPERLLEIRCLVLNGILKVSCFLTETMRFGGRLPIYDIYLDAKNMEYLTYSPDKKKWFTGSAVRLDWSSMYFPYSGIYVSREATKTLRKYFNSDKSGFEIITGFQQRVLDRNLEMKHKKETYPWDEDLKQTPELPKNLVKWFDKYAICEHFIFYRYTEKKNKTGYCTYCQKEVPIENPHYNAKGVCPCCHNEIVFKSLGKVGYFSTENHQAYVLQRCKDGIMIREFDVRRIYYRGEPFAPKVHQSECRRIICDSHGYPQRAYYYGTYKQKELRWIATGIVSHYYGIYSGKIYPRTLNTLSLKELKETGLKEMYLHYGIIDPERYLSRLSEQPFIEKFVKAELFKLAEEQISEGAYRTAYSINPTAGSLAKFLCIDSQKLKELRSCDGGTEHLKWLQFEKKSGQVIDFKLKIWLLENKASPEDLSFITDKMSIRQIYNYITRQMKVSGIDFNTVLNTWQDYLSMAKKLNIDTDDEIVYRTSRLQQRHAELVNELQKKGLSDRAAEIAENYPDINKVFEYVKSKYEYSEGEYSVIAPSGIVDLLTEGRNLRHCVADQERYIDRIHRWESYILFLRRTAEPDVSYYTLEVEPGGSVRQKRTLYDRQNPDIEDASCFLKKWQSVIKERLSREDIKLAETSKALRLEEFAQLDKDNIIVHGGELNNLRLVDVLMKDLMEAA